MCQALEWALGVGKKTRTLSPNGVLTPPATYSRQGCFLCEFLHGSVSLRLQSHIVCCGTFAWSSQEPQGVENFSRRQRGAHLPFLRKLAWIWDGKREPQATTSEARQSYANQAVSSTQLHSNPCGEPWGLGREWRSFRSSGGVLRKHPFSCGLVFSNHWSPNMTITHWLWSHGYWE